MSRWRDVFISLRPWQWLKNGFVFTALVLSGQLFRVPPLGQTVVVFLSFCLIASAGYLLNDVIDRRYDQQHPVKRHRPIAAGRISVRAALWWAAGLVTLGLGMGGGVHAGVGWVLLAYTVLTIAYSIWFKEVAVLDVITVALGYVLRMIAGGVAVGAMPSAWAMVCVFSLACLLSIGKRVREQEISGAPSSHRATLKPYAAHQRPLLLLAATLTTTLYVFFSVSIGHRGYLALTVPCVVYGIWRYLYLIQTVKLGDMPDKLLFQDRPLLAIVMLWGVMAIGVLYGHA